MHEQNSPRTSQPNSPRQSPDNNPPPTPQLKHTEPEVPNFEIRTYNPGQSYNRTYGSSHLRLFPITGNQFFSDKVRRTAKEVPFEKLTPFNTLVNWLDLHWNNAKFRKKEHALCLAATAFNIPIEVPTLQFVEDQVQALEHEFSALDAFCQGTCLEYGHSTEQFYTGDLAIYEELFSRLEDRIKCTMEVSKFSSWYVPNVPVFSKNLGEFPVDRIYSRNDWEILAITY